jgi:hypothetical protein
LRHAKEHRIQVQDTVFVAQVLELSEPPPVGGSVADLPLALDRWTPRGEFGGALDEDQPRVMLRGVVQHAVCCGAVTLRPSDSRVELGVVKVEQ